MLNREEKTMKKLKLNKSIVSKLNAIDEMDKVKGGVPYTWFNICLSEHTCKPYSLCICAAE